MMRMQCLLSATLLAGAILARPAIALNAPAPAAAATGAKIFGKWCSDCHSTASGPGSMALQRQYQGSVSPILEQRSDLNPGYVVQVVRHGMSFMPSFRKTEISDAELADVAAYVTTAHTRAKTAMSTKAGR